MDSFCCLLSHNIFWDFVFLLLLGVCFLLLQNDEDNSLAVNVAFWGMQARCLSLELCEV